MELGINDPTWEDGIKSLFSETDKVSIRKHGINPDDYRDVALNAHEICELAATGLNRWSQKKLARFRLWIHSGMLKGAPGIVTLQPPASSDPPERQPQKKMPRLPDTGGPQYDIARILGSRGVLGHEAAATLTSSMSAWRGFADALRHNRKLRQAAQAQTPVNLTEHACFALTLYADFLQGLANVPAKGALWYYAELARLNNRESPTL